MYSLHWIPEGKNMNVRRVGLRYIVGGVLLGTVLLLGGGCGGAPQQGRDASETPLTTEDGSPARKHAVQCRGAEGDVVTFRALVRPDSLALRVPAAFGGDTRHLVAVRAASGAKYEGGGATVWSKGGTATVEIDGQRLGDCTISPQTEQQDEHPPDLQFRAVGQEPGWIVEVTDDSLRFAWAYGQRAVTAAQFVTDTDDERMVYRADTDRGPLRVEAEPKYCTDPMNGRLFSHTVTVTLAGDTHTGCGHPTR